MLLWGPEFYTNCVESSPKSGATPPSLPKQPPARPHPVVTPPARFGSRLFHTLPLTRYPEKQLPKTFDDLQPPLRVQLQPLQQRRH